MSEVKELQDWSRKLRSLKGDLKVAKALGNQAVVRKVKEEIVVGRKRVNTIERKRGMRITSWQH